MGILRFGWEGVRFVVIGSRGCWGCAFYRLGLELGVLSRIRGSFGFLG